MTQHPVDRYCRTLGCAGVQETHGVIQRSITTPAFLFPVRPNTAELNRTSRCLTPFIVADCLKLCGRDCHTSMVNRDRVNVATAPPPIYRRDTSLVLNTTIQPLELKTLEIIENMDLTIAVNGSVVAGVSSRAMMVGLM